MKDHWILRSINSVQFYKIANRSIICLLLVWIVPTTAFSQVIAVANENMNILYLGIPNPIVVAVENISSKSFIVTTDNGDIYADTKEGHYIIQPVHVGTATVYIEKKYKNGQIKTVGSVIFKVKRYPMPVVQLSGRTAGKFDKGLLCAQIALSALTLGMDIDARFAVTRYTVVVKRRKRTIFSHSLSDFNGTRIDSVTNKFFKKLHNKDTVIFKDIQVKDMYGIEDYPKSLEFFVSGAKEYAKAPKHGEKVILDPITGQEKIIKW